MKISKTLYVPTRDLWRAWLEKHHDKEPDIWLVFYKRHTGRPSLPYDDAVEEALCFGWIDSIIQRIDDEKYAQRFSPRRSTSKWSELNKKRVAQMIRQGRMTKAGLVTLSYRRGSGGAAAPATGSKDPAAPPSFKRALQANAAARENWQQLAPSYRRLYLRWITDAKKQETIERRVKEAIGLLQQNKKFPMK